MPQQLQQTLTACHCPISRLGNGVGKKGQQHEKAAQNSEQAC
jgi:hypothetical protein